MVDSDGDVRALVDLWIESGVDIVVPWDNYQYFYSKLKEIIYKY